MCGKRPNFGHFYKINDKSQNVHTADLGYLGFQNYHKNFQLCSIKMKGSHAPCDVMQVLYISRDPNGGGVGIGNEDLRTRRLTPIPAT